MARELPRSGPRSARDSNFWVPACAGKTLMTTSRRRIGSPHGRCVLDTALGPEPVDAAADAELRARSHITFEHFAVIADLLDDADDPVLAQAQLLAEVALDAQEAPDLGLVGLQRLVDVLGGDAELLGIEHREERPLDDVEPWVVAMTDERPEWFLRDDFGQNDVVVGIGQLELLRVELRHVGGEYVATARFVRLHGLVGGTERDHLVLHVVGAEEVGEIELGGGAGLGAYRRPIELQR